MIHIAVLFASLIGGGGAAASAQARPAEIALREFQVIRPVGRYGRNAIHTDAIEAQIVAGKWSPPKAGDSVALPDGRTQTWTTATAGQDGWLADPALNGGYAYAMVDSPTERIMLLEAAGHNMVYVNGEPRTGDPYSYGYVKLPVLLKKGPNNFLFHVSRGRLRAKLTTPRKPVMLDAADSTYPDIVEGGAKPVWCSVVVANATRKALTRGLILFEGSGSEIAVTAMPVIPPLTCRKIPLKIRIDDLKRAKGNAIGGIVTVGDASVAPLAGWDSINLTFRVRKAGQTHKRTFISTIDDSLQYYAVNPAVPVSKTSGNSKSNRPTLFLSLHGASVEAIGQADAYSPKSWGHIVCPTNRRPYGFDWEDWGRLDAMEVLNLAQNQLHTDPARTYLTGHSMGGHGAWQIGAQYPDRFAAIAPSAGWISFWSYAGGSRKENPSPMEEMFQRAANPSDTLALSHNYTHDGVYILHGGADDNVPVSEARAMSKQLAGFHHDFTYFEQPGAGHWWDLSDEPGADCVDWAPIFDLFAHRTIPADSEVRQIDFTTANPGINAWSHWAGIIQQIHPLKFSRVQIRFDPEVLRFVGTTENVACLELKSPNLPPDRRVRVEVDGSKLDYDSAYDCIQLRQVGGKWAVAPTATNYEKGPHRAGPFKDAFRNRMMFVYGTAGTPEENQWAFGKARFDAETWWYRANGSVDVIPDAEFNPRKGPSRNVILYGNADTNRAWRLLLGDCPVQVRRGAVTVGGRTISGDDSAVLFLYPRRNWESVGVVAGTGLTGMRLTDRAPYFVSGVAYPDVTVIGPESLTNGIAGVRAAGFFGNDWRVESGEFVWAK